MGRSAHFGDDAVDVAADPAARDREAELLTVRPVALAGVEIEAGRPEPPDGEVLET